MRLVVFSDIHGNCAALKSLVSAEEYESRYIFLGDVVGYYYDAEDCVEALGKLNLVAAVRGNHDQYYISSFADTEMTGRLVSEYGSTYSEKSKDVFKFLTMLPMQKRMEIEGKCVYIQHGNPQQCIEGRWYPDTEIDDTQLGEADVILCGNTHYRMHRVIGDCHVINPGSLGQPRDGMGFSYCIVETDSMEVEFRNISVDLNELERRIKRNDPDKPYLIEVLRRGYS